MVGDSPTCPGPLRHSHNLWTWHRTEVRRTAISGYHYGRLPDVQKAWLQPESKREALHFASYDVVELQTLGKYANVRPRTSAQMDFWSRFRGPDQVYLVVLPGSDTYYLIALPGDCYLSSLPDVLT